MFIPFVGFLFYMWKRPKQVVVSDYNKLPYGFRSKRKWKMVIATIAYIFLFAFTVMAGTLPTSDTSKAQVPVVKATSTLSNAQATETKKPDATAESQAAPISAKVEHDTVQPTEVKTGDKLKVSYIDVGQADSILVQIPNGKNLLIDTGNRDDYGTIANYLKNQGVNKIDILVLTHMHEDHIGSSPEIIKNFTIGQVVMPKQSATTQIFKNLVSAMGSKGLSPIQAKAGVKLDLGNEVSAQLIAPNSTSYEDANDYSGVIRITYGNNTFLFMGDAQALSESKIINAGYSLKADVLKVGHHGSHTSTSPAFLAKVKPKYAVISVGKGNSYGHPASDTLSKLANEGATVYRTDENGTVVATSDGTNIAFQTFGSSVQPRSPSSSSSSGGSSPSSTVSTPAPAPIPVVTPAPSSSSNDDQIVYITKTGKDYHTDGCRYLSKSKIQITLREAKAKGYKPDHIGCNAPE